MAGKPHRSELKLTPKQVEELLEVGGKTLASWRRKKIGPPYCREVNRIYYYREDLEAWRQSTKWS